MVGKYFKEAYTVRWSKQYQDIVNTLTGKQENGEKMSPFLPFYDTNAGVLILAACIGLLKGLELDVSSSNTNEIDSLTFDRAEFNHTSFSHYIALIVLLYKKDPNIIKNTNDQEVIKIFQRLAAGGLEYLKGSIYNRANKDMTGRAILLDETAKAFRDFEILDESNEIIDIL